MMYPSGTPRLLTTPDILARAWHGAGPMMQAWAQPAITASEAAPLTSSHFLGGLRRSFAGSPW